jgi:hypothetical protein
MSLTNQTICSTVEVLRELLNIEDLRFGPVEPIDHFAVFGSMILLSTDQPFSIEWAKRLEGEMMVKRVTLAGEKVMAEVAMNLGDYRASIRHDQRIGSSVFRPNLMPPTWPSA